MGNLLIVLLLLIQEAIYSGIHIKQVNYYNLIMTFLLIDILNRNYNNYL